MALAGAALACAVLPAHAAPAQAPPAGGCAGAGQPPSTPAAGRAMTICRLNEVRAQHGLRAVRFHPDLARVSRTQAAEMVARRYFSHTSPVSGNFARRVRLAGYPPRDEEYCAGEVLGWGTGVLSTPAALVDAWLQSPPHREVVLDRHWQHAAAGVVPGVPSDAASGETYAVAFGTHGFC